MGDAERGQVSTGAAEVYDRFFVPALFAPWAGVVLDAAGVGAGHRVLDVGCGTGVLAGAARARVGDRGHVAAVDPNEGMLAVARRARPGVEWHAGVAETLPFPDRSFDRTVSQFALMFFSDAGAAFAEMARVTRPAGRVAVAVWDGLDGNAGYAGFADLVEQLFGADAADAIRAPFRLGDVPSLLDVAGAGLAGATVTRHGGTARFPSLEAWVHTEIRGWTLADTVDDAGLGALVAAARERFADLVGPDGLALPVSALVLSGGPAPGAAGPPGP